MKYIESEEAKAEKEFIKESLRILKGGGCWITEDTPTSKCLGPKLVNGGNSCTSCTFYNDFYRIADTYRENKGVTASESIWLARQFFGIESRYMCDGNDGEWQKVNAPEHYKKNLKRQAELMAGITIGTELMSAPAADKTEPQLTGQMSIMDWFNENE